MLRQSNRSPQQAICLHLAASKRTGNQSLEKSLDKGTLPLSRPMAWRPKENRPYNRPSVHFLKEQGIWVPPHFGHIHGCSTNHYQISIGWMRSIDHDVDPAQLMLPPFSHGDVGYPQAAHGGSFVIRPRLHVDNLSIERLLADASEGKYPDRNQPKSNEEELTNELQFA